MKRLIKPLWLALATLSALLTVVSCVKELAVKEQEVNFESSLTTEQSQIVKGDSTVTTQLLINEEEVDCPRPTKYSVSFTYDEEAGTLFFLGDSIQSGKPIALSSLSNLALTYQAKKLVGNKVDVTVSNDAPKKLSKDLVWNILADKTYWVKSEQEGEGKVAITGADDLNRVPAGTKLTVATEPADGWEVKSITANGKDITTEKSFVVTSNTIVKVVFKKLPPKTYAVTLTKEGEGEVDISGADNLGAVVTGSKLTVTAEPADGWEVKSITANGKDITTDKSFVVTENTLVRVAFSRRKCTVKIVGRGYGFVELHPVRSDTYSSHVKSVVDYVRVQYAYFPYGSVVKVVATPQTSAFALKSLLCDGQEIANGSFITIADDISIVGTFERLPPSDSNL